MDSTLVVCLEKEVFGKGKIDHYRTEIADALSCRNKYTNEHGLLHPNIIIFIKMPEDTLASKGAIYSALQSFINGKNEITCSDVLFSSDLLYILKAAKVYIDEFNKDIK